MIHRILKPHVSINEVACYRTERVLVRCVDPPSKEVGAPHQYPRINEKHSGWGVIVTDLSTAPLLPLGSVVCFGRGAAGAFSAATFGAADLFGVVGAAVPTGREGVV